MIQADEQRLSSTHREARDGARSRLAPHAIITFDERQHVLDQLVLEGFHTFEKHIGRETTRGGKRVAVGHDDYHGPRFALREQVVHDEIYPSEFAPGGVVIAAAMQ